MDVLSKVEADLAARKKARRGDWVKLVRAVVDEKAPSADAIEATLAACEKTFDDLRAACGAIQNRRQWREQLDAYEAAKGERPGLESQIAAAQAALKEAREKFQKTIAPLVERKEQIDKMQATAGTARTMLLKTFADEALLEREQELKQRLNQLRKTLEAREGFVASKERAGAEHEANLAKARSMPIGSDPSSAVYKKNQIAKFEGAVEFCRDNAAKVRAEELPPLRREIAEVERELKSIDAAKFSA